MASCYQSSDMNDKLRNTETDMGLIHPWVELGHILLLMGRSGRVCYLTRSQAVAMIADRTAPTAPLGSRDVIGHVTI